MNFINKNNIEIVSHFDELIMYITYDEFHSIFSRMQRKEMEIVTCKIFKEANNEPHINFGLDFHQWFVTRSLEFVIVCIFWWHSRATLKIFLMHAWSFFQHNTFSCEKSFYVQYKKSFFMGWSKNRFYEKKQNGNHWYKKSLATNESRGEPTHEFKGNCCLWQGCFITAFNSLEKNLYTPISWLKS